jgi:hypothetical protein
VVPICRCEDSAQPGKEYIRFIFKIMAYLAVHLPEIKAVSGLQNLSERLMALVLHESGLAVKNELEIFETACSWVKDQALQVPLPTGLEGELPLSWDCASSYPSLCLFPTLS